MKFFGKRAEISNCLALRERISTFTEYPAPSCLLRQIPSCCRSTDAPVLPVARFQTPLCHDGLHFPDHRKSFCLPPSDTRPTTSAYSVPLKLELLSQNPEVMEKFRFLVIGIRPGKRSIRSLLVDQGEIGIDPVPQINPVSEILAGRQDEPFFIEYSRIDIDPPPSLTGKRALQSVGLSFISGRESGRTGSRNPAVSLRRPPFPISRS